MEPKQIEVEYRAQMSEEAYAALITFLNVYAEDLGEDDKAIHFFTFPDKLLKVTDNITQKSAKITLKLNRIGNGAMFEEIEVPIAQTDVDKTVRMFQTLNFGEYIAEPIVRRHNYLYKGVELAVKYSVTWGYHVELEILINDSAHYLSAEAKIKEVAQELNLTLMTDEELSAFVANLEASRKSKI